MDDTDAKDFTVDPVVDICLRCAEPADADAHLYSDDPAYGYANPYPASD